MRQSTGSPSWWRAGHTGRIGLRKLLTALFFAARGDAPPDQFLDLALTADAQRRVRPHFEPFGADLLATALADPILALLDRPQGSLHTLQLMLKLGEQSDVFLALDQIRVAFFGIDVDFDLKRFAQALNAPVIRVRSSISLRRSRVTISSLVSPFL